MSHGQAARRLRIAEVAIAFLLSLAARPAVAASFLYQGQLFDVTGTTPLTGTATFALEILSPLPSSCVLYAETQSAIPLDSEGRFSVVVGTGTRTGSDPGLTMSQVFANSQTVGSGTLTPASGGTCSGTYTSGASDLRFLQVTVTPEGGSANLLSPNITLGGATDASSADTLAGLLPKQFLQVTGNSSAYAIPKATLDAVLGTSGVVDASAFHNHDSRYVQIGSSPQNIGSGGLYTSGAVGIGLSVPPSGTQFEVTPAAAATVAETIVGAASQTADLFDLKSGGGSVLASFNATGYLTLPGAPTSANQAATKGYVDGLSYLSSAALVSILGFTPVSGAASLTDLGTLAEVSGAGAIGEAAGITTSTTSNITKLVVKAGSAQSTTDLQDWSSVAGSILYSVNSSGTPTATTDLVTKGYLTSATGGFLPLAGGTMTGALALPGGTNAAPALTWSSDLTTGINGSSGSISFTLAGVSTLLIGQTLARSSAPFLIQNNNDTSETVLAIGSVGTGYAATFSGGNVGIGTTTPVDPFSLGATATGATHALVNLSNTALSGGSANGTYLGANPATAGPDFINYQVNGQSEFQVDAAGDVTSQGSIGSAAGMSTVHWDGTTYTPSSTTSSAPTSTSFLSVSNSNATSGTMGQLTIAARNSNGYVNDYLDVISPVSGYSPALTFVQQTGATAFKERMRIDTTGYIGIATTAPEAALDVAMAGGASRPAVAIDGAWFTGGTASTTTPQLLVQPVGTTSSTWSTQGTALGINAASGFTGNLVDFQVNGTSKFRIDTSGDVYQAGSVTVAGTSSLTGTYSVNATGTAATVLGGGGGPVSIATSGTAAVAIGDSTDTVTLQGSALSLNSTGGGAVTIGSSSGSVAMNAATTLTSTSSPQFSVKYDATDYLTAGVGSTGETIFSVAGTSAGFAFSGGYVGIGTTTPVSRLTVPWIAGDGVPTVTFGAGTSGNSQIALNALTYSGSAAVYGSALGSGAGVTGTSASGAGISGSSASSYSGYFKSSSSANTSPTLAVQAVTSGTADPFDVLSSTGTVMFSVSNWGLVSIGVPTLQAAFDVTTTGGASMPAVRLEGSWYTGGTATTTKPQLLIEPAGTTSTAWSTAGTGIGVNAVSTFAGNLLDLQMNGASKFSVNHNGGVGIQTASPFNALDVAGGVALGTYAGTTSAPTNGLIISGNVGIGTTANTGLYALSVNGSIVPAADDSSSLGSSTLRFLSVYAVNGTINTSDAREKKDIVGSDLGLDFVNRLRPVSYRWKKGPDSLLHYGFIAQETEKAIHDVHPDGDLPIVDHDVKTDRYGIRYTELISPVIKGMQELYGIVKAQGANLAALQVQAPGARTPASSLVKLSRHSSAPEVCTAANDGALALNTRNAICVCDAAKGWVAYGSTDTCAW